MLKLSTSQLVDDITIFDDHEKPDQKWYLSGPVELAWNNSTNKKEFSFIKYTSDAKSMGGGFLMFRVCLPKLTPSMESKIKKSYPNGNNITLSPVQFEKGLVECIALNLQGSGGTSAKEEGNGKFVEKILGAGVPSFFSDNSAIFSLGLDEEGAQILESAFENNLTPIGVIYNLQFTGLRPALDVIITSNYDKIYNELSLNLSGKYEYFSGEIDAALKILQQKGIIKIEITNFTTEDDKKDQEKWALDLFKEKILNDWFTPTLSPKNPTGETQKQDPTKTQSSTTGTAGKTGVTPKAELKIDSRSPTSSQATEYNIVLTPPTSGTTEKLQIKNYNNAKYKLTVKVDNTPSNIDSQGNVSVVLPAGTTKVITVIYSPSESKPGEASDVTIKATLTRPLPDQPASGDKPNLPLANTPQGPGNYGNPDIKLRLKAEHIHENKEFTLNYNSTDAIVKTYAPQGFFGLLLGSEDKSRYMQSVSLNDPFFKKYIVDLISPTKEDFSKLGLNSVNLCMGYGDPKEERTFKRKEFQFTCDSYKNDKFEVYMNENLDTSFRYNLEYYFDPGSAWEGQGQQVSYRFSGLKTNSGSLNLNPCEYMNFEKIDIKLGEDINWDLLNSIDVNLQFPDEENKFNKTFTFTKGSNPQQWCVRMGDKKGAVGNFKKIYNMKNGLPIEIEGKINSGTIIVNDPTSLIIYVINQIDAEYIYLNFEYKDTENNYSFNDMLSFEKPKKGDHKKFKIPLINVNKLDFECNVTAIDGNGVDKTGVIVKKNDKLNVNIMIRNEDLK